MANCTSSSKLVLENWKREVLMQTSFLEDQTQRLLQKLYFYTIDTAQQSQQEANSKGDDKENKENNLKN